ncbi:putative acetylcholine receptor [Fasciola hepatica]|uniref:Acetylcholine receptor n=1 Tax=Fasciola hepatica TaxID=6192 RepID=A0A4E0S394_FASHE|nr:putative acetylcholine receptor [Fasciola hepatica]
MMFVKNSVIDLPFFRARTYVLLHLLLSSYSVGATQVETNATSPKDQQSVQVSNVSKTRTTNDGTFGDFVIPDEQRLLQHILKDYDPASRPTYVASNSVNVGFQMTLVQINQLDEVNQVLTLNVWIEQEWNDERLRWNPADYNNLQIIRIPCDKLWLPDIVLYNSADDYTSGYMQIKAMVHSTGNVFWSPPAKLRSACKIDITYFPFDDQSCMMKFGSWAYDGWQLNITKRHEDVDMSNYVPNGEWDLLKVTVDRFEIVYPCCKEPYPDLRFTIYMRRRTLYYLFNIIFPCLWLTVLSLISFWLPPDSGEKITLGITVLLAFSVFMLLIAENMPATSEFVPLIGIYLTVTMAMTSLSIILTVGVLHLHHKGPHNTPVPKRIRIILFDYVAPFLRMSSVERYRLTRQEQWTQSKSEYNSHSGRTNLVLGPLVLEQQKRAVLHTGSNKQSRNNRQLSSTISGDNSTRFSGTSKHTMHSRCTASPERYTERPTVTRANAISITLEEKDQDQTDEAKDQRSHNERNLTHPTGWSEIRGTPRNRSCCDLNSLNGQVWTEASEIERRLVVEDLSRLIWHADQQQAHMDEYLKMLQRNQSLEEHSLDIMNEWRTVALIVDRTLFWLFLVVATLATIVILIVMPLFKPNQLTR